MTDYEPGTVAVATVRGVPNVRVMGYANSGSSARWFSERLTNRYHCHDERHVTDIRPLVVLDIDYPGTFARHLRSLGTPGTTFHAVADQIEAQTKPPKPTEPTGLGAVVEDASGRRWLLAFDRHCWHNGSATTWLSYAEIDVVKVLSAGVSRG